MEDEGKGEMRMKAVRIVRSVVESRETNVWIGQKKTRTKKKKRERNSNDACARHSLQYSTQI